LGYWQKPELTQTVFLPAPEGENLRVYRTGDMGRLLHNGSIEVVGRKDFQIKLRGFRIELGEIEFVLSQHPAVQENVVIVYEETSHDKRLVAYLVPKPETMIETTELRHFLKEKLPDYMIPSAFIPLEAMPLTPTNKINRRALVQLSVDSLKLSEETFVAPRTPEEELLAGIWATVLGIERVGSHDNFFDLGGHSLLATQVMSRIREAFSIKLPLINLFKYPTVAGLAERIADIRVAQSLRLSANDAVKVQQYEEGGVL
ncbi:MAG: non-ribosomal peptide synthetase, partial [Candidatus Parabeggiatoa sp. nov. 1]